MPAKEHVAINRAAAREYVRAINARTVCAHCGAQPIEWHNPEHVELKRETHRIGNMVTQPATIQAIEAEISRCTPLCRRCHMAEDGRLESFRRTTQRGEVNGRAKLTEADVRQIRASHGDGATVASLASQYTVTWRTIHLIVTRETWKHVE